MGRGAVLRAGCCIKATAGVLGTAVRRGSVALHINPGPLGCLIPGFELTDEKCSFLLDIWEQRKTPLERGAACRRRSGEEAQLSLRLPVIALACCRDFRELVPLLNLRDSSGVHIVVRCDSIQEVTDSDALLDDRDVRGLDTIRGFAAVAAKLGSSHDLSL